MPRDKLILLGAGFFGFGVWGAAGFAFRGWEGATVAVLLIGLLGCAGYTFGNAWRYFTMPEAPKADPSGITIFDARWTDISEAVDAFREDTLLYPFGPPSQKEALERIVRDWLVGHGYLREAADTDEAC